SARWVHEWGSGRGARLECTPRVGSLRARSWEPGTENREPHAASSADDYLHPSRPAAQILLTSSTRSGRGGKLLRPAVHAENIGDVRVVRIAGHANPSMQPDLGAGLEDPPDMTDVH